MELEEETEQLLEFYKSLSDDQAVQFMRVLGSATLHGEEFIKAGIRTLLEHELKLFPKEKVYIFEAYGSSIGGPNPWCKREYSVSASSMDEAEKKMVEWLHKSSDYRDKTFTFLRVETGKEKD